MSGMGKQCHEVIHQFRVAIVADFFIIGEVIIWFRKAEKKKPLWFCLLPVFATFYIVSPDFLISIDALINNYDFNLMQMDTLRSAWQSISGLS